MKTSDRSSVLISLLGRRYSNKERGHFLKQICINFFNSAISVQIFVIVLVFLFCMSFFFYFVMFEDTINNSLIKLTTKNAHTFRFLRIKSFDSSFSKTNKEIMEKERLIFQIVRQDHIKLIEKFTVINDKIEAILKEISIKDPELKNLELQIKELRLLQQESSDKRNFFLKLPNPPLRPTAEVFLKSEKNSSNFVFQNLDSGIDYRRCSISSLFRAYLYFPLTPLQSSSAHFLFDELSVRKSITKNASEACVFVAVFENNLKNLKSLKYWQEFGRNHLIILINPTQAVNTGDVGAAMVVSSNFKANFFRREMDIVIHSMIFPYEITEYQRLPQLLPFAREHLISFLSGNFGLRSIERSNFDFLIKSLKNSNDDYLINTNCLLLPLNSTITERLPLCYDEKRRVTLTRRSFFSLIFPDCDSFQQRFYESLLAGAIPVVVATSKTIAPLPFQEFIDWRLAVVRIAAARLPELHFILNSIVTSDILEMRRKGRFFLENYLSNAKVLSSAILSSVRFSLQALNDGTPTIDPINNYLTFPSYFVTTIRPPYDNEYLGPVEAPTSSFSFRHNATVIRMHSYKMWNELPSHVEFTSEFLETKHTFPSEAEFDNFTNFKMRPIAPGSGQEFSQALGGNHPSEQFTIIMMTYNRDAVLNMSLERLHKLPYLNCVIVLWNNIDRSPNASVWPRLHVPIVFVKMTRNSLNNRFLPFKEIKTEAVLSLDDDIDLKQYEIIFAFRVWREQRHRIVGFPARYHARYGDSMFYNSNHTCQHSMILTGAAFFHKAYLHAYTNAMPEIIRKKVDEWINCEDLAMNFLVSHLTRQPPIKTTSKWNFRCPNCSENLSNGTSYLNERNICIRFFTQVYGYNPLLFTQFRVDSVLFKTRVPSNHQKCFRIV